MITEKSLLDHLNKTLPVSDLASVSEEVLQSFVSHALFLRENSPFSKDLPEELFLNFVFYPRINTEDLTDCRAFFYDLLKDRIRGLSAVDAILEINRFCCENMTYQTTDDRTQNPMTSYKAGLGRCGEESTFAVTAFRSVGIPARQVYVPYWTHCDDNHAWVEVYADDKWYFLGACEPEPVLNRGWFTDASSRAPLACYRLFGNEDYVPDTGDEMYERRGISCFYNVVTRYAKTCELKILVRMPDGTPAKHCPVYLKVVNYAEYADLVNAVTDENGEYRITIGRISLHVEASSADGFAMADLELAEAGENFLCTLTLSHELPDDLTVETTEVPPPVAPVNRTFLTDKQQNENTELLARCAEIRNERITGYFLPEYETYDAEIQELLHLAGGNAGEIHDFLKGLNADERDVGIALLKVLTRKDLRDITSDLLNAHLKASMPYRDKRGFVEKILNPRIEHEMITDWRSDILAYYTAEELKAFVENPAFLREDIERRFHEGKARFYPALRMTPGAVLKSGCADETGRKILHTAVLRTMGIAAELEVIGNNNAEANDFGCLELCREDSEALKYGRHYTISRYVEGHSAYETLALKDEDLISLHSGHYRLLTTNRLPNGSQRIRTTYFTIKAGETTKTPLLLSNAEPSEMLSNAELESFVLKNSKGLVSSSELLTAPTVLLYPDPSKEPTEHILNELMMCSEEMKALMDKGVRLALALRSEEALQDPTLQKTIALLPGTEIFYENSPADTVMLARKLFQEPGVWPLLIMAGPEHRGYFGSCGYSVGTADLVIKLLKCINGPKENS